MKRSISRRTADSPPRATPTDLNTTGTGSFRPGPSLSPATLPHTVFRTHRSDRRKSILTADTARTMRAILVLELNHVAAKANDWHRLYMKDMDTNDPVYAFVRSQMARYDTTISLLRELIVGIGSRKFDTDKIPDALLQASQCPEPGTFRKTRKGKS